MINWVFWFLLLWIILSVILISIVSWRENRYLRQRLDLFYAYQPPASKTQRSSNRRFQDQFLSPLWRFLIVFLIPLIGFIICLMSGSILFAFVFLLAYFLIVLLAYIVSDQIRQRRRLQFNQQTVVVVEMMIEQLSAGHSVLTALKAIAEHVKKPLGSVLTRLHQQVALGRPLLEEIDYWMRRYPYHNWVLFFIDDENARCLWGRHYTPPDIVVTVNRAIQ